MEGIAPRKNVFWRVLVEKLYNLPELGGGAFKEVFPKENKHSQATNIGFAEVPHKRLLIKVFDEKFCRFFCHEEERPICLPVPKSDVGHALP